MLRPLTKANVEKHLGVLGLEAEFATHAHIHGLSGGQKVKVVLAACTWNQPHILVMDEPTNYLDRDSLGALAGAIREFGGGVVIISHHNEFTTALCPEKWTVADGKCVVTGAPQVGWIWLRVNAGGCACQGMQWAVFKGWMLACSSRCQGMQCVHECKEREGEWCCLQTVSSCIAESDLGMPQCLHVAATHLLLYLSSSGGVFTCCTHRHKLLPPTPPTHHPPQVMTREKVEFKVQEEVIDAFGNTIKVKGPKKELSRKEKKAKAKERAARKARGEEVTDSEEDE
jgi:energy-coupling factor transporter ATP-binding protein EcfA2